MAQKPASPDPYWVLSLWILGNLLYLLHVSGAAAVSLYVLRRIWLGSDRGPLAGFVEISACVFMFLTVYVSHAQLRFLWNRLLASELEKGDK